jgi:hypothetical protein
MPNTSPKWFISCDNRIFVEVEASALKMEAVCSSETLAPSYNSTRHYSPEDQHRQMTTSGPYYKHPKIVVFKREGN